MVLRPLAFALLAAFGFSALAAPVVRNARALPTYGDPLSGDIHAGNFGGDAANDILTVVGGHAIQVLINGPSGLTDEPVITPIDETWIKGVATGDIDADGDLDVAISFPATGQLVVYRNDGSGAFDTATVIGNQTGGLPAFGDFTGDGHADLALLRDYAYNDGEALVFPGNGAGTFGTAVTTLLPDAPRTVRLLDANDDGKLDMLVAGSFAIMVALGNGAGAFTAVTIPGGIAGGLDIGDFDGDGDTDFVVIADHELASEFLRVFLNDGTGIFAASGDYFGMFYFAVTVADVDADGHSDLIGGSLAGNVAVLRGNGDGTFEQTPVLWHSGPVRDVVAGDFNRDTVADLVVVGSAYARDLRMIVGTSPGQFDAYRAWLPNGAAAYEVTFDRHTFQTIAADVNGDGAADVVTVVLKDSSASVSSISVMLNANDGAATMLPATTTDAAFGDAQIATGDIDGDGKSDVVAVGDAYLQVFFGRDDGLDALSPQSIGSGGAPSLADVTGDGVPDLIVSRAADSTLHRGSADGSFADPLLLPFSVHAIGDVNGDGDADFAGHAGGPTAIAINNGSGTAFAVTIVPDGGSGVDALEDFDGDGHRDILLLHVNAGVTTLFGNGDGTFDAARYFHVAPPVLESGASPRVRTGDFDGDGKLDVVRGVRFYLGDGAGAFDGYAEVVSRAQEGFDVADFDGNGTDDVAVVTGDESVAIIRTGLGFDPTDAATIELALDPAQPQYAQRVHYIATLSAGPRPTGAVVFARNGVPFEMRGAGALEPGASAAHPLGTVTIDATYTGDDRFAPAGVTLQHDVVRATTSLFMSGYQSTAMCGREIFANVALSAPGAAGLPGPTGELTFREGSTPLQSRPRPGYPPGSYLIADLGTGSHTITAEYPGDANYHPSSVQFSVEITPLHDATISAGSAVFAGGVGYASATSYSGVKYAWTIANGTIEAGQGTPSIRYVAGPSGEVTLGLTISVSYCNATGTRAIPILARAPGASMLHILTPCRAYDSRGGAALEQGVTRELVLGGICGIPDDAKSLAVNVTVVSPSASGWLSLYASDTAWPGTSTINFRAAKTRANNTIAGVAPGGRVTVRHSGPPIHFIIDVFGYFR